jgi:hypothetical protein
MNLNPEDGGSTASEMTVSNYKIMWHKKPENHDYYISTMKTSNYTLIIYV